MSDLIAFTWDAFRGGVIYDLIKPILGNGFQKLAEFFNGNQRREFEIALEATLEANENIKHQLEALKNSIQITQGNNSNTNFGTQNISNGSSGSGNIANTTTINNNYGSNTQDPSKKN